MVKHHAVIFYRPLHADEAARHILLHEHRVSAVGISPAAAATGDQAQEVAALQLDTIARRQDVTHLRCAWIQQDFPGPPGASTRHAIWWEFAIFHAIA